MLTFSKYFCMLKDCYLPNMWYSYTEHDHHFAFILLVTQSVLLSSNQTHCSYWQESFWGQKNMVWWISSFTHSVCCFLRTSLVMDVPRLSYVYIVCHKSEGLDPMSYPWIKPQHKMSLISVNRHIAESGCSIATGLLLYQ